MVIPERFKKQEKLCSPYILLAAVLRSQQRALALIGLCLYFALPARPQVTVAPLITPSIQLSDNSGNPINGGCVFFYAAGTTTPQATYTDSTGTVAASNPVILDSAGRAQIWLSALAYKIKVFTAGGVNCATGTQVGVTVDNVTWTTPLSTFLGLTVAGNLNVTQPTAATGSANQSSFTDCLHGTYWTGAASADDKWCLQDVLGTGSNPTTTWTLTHTGSTGLASASLPALGIITANSINGLIFLDGNKYALTVAGLQSALSDCNASSACSGVDARQLGSVSGTTTTVIPANRCLWLGSNTAISGTSDPVMSFGTDSCIIGATGDITLTTVSAIISTAAASRVLAPTSTNPHILYPLFRGVALINTSASRTAKILDLTNTNHARIQDVGFSSSGGSADMVFVTIVAPVVDAFWNNFDGVKLQGTGTEVGYHFDGGANSQVVKGGFVNNVLTCYSVSQGGAAVTDDIEFIGTTCEANTGAALVTTGLVQSVHGIGNRMEANTPATLFNTSASSSHIEMNSTAEFGTQNCGTANGVSFIGWPLGSPCTPSASGAGNTAEIYTVRDINANFFTGRAATASATNTFTGSTLNDSGVFSADALGSGFGLQIQDSNGSGHNFRLGDINCAGCFNIRDLTQTGQPFWGFRATSTAASVEGRFAHAITATRTWTMPDQTGTTMLQVGATSQKAETGTADANVLTVTPLAVVGTYRACATISVASATGGVISWTLSWTDSSGNAQSNIAQPLFQFGTAAPNTTFTTSAAGNYTGCSTIDTNNAAANIVVKWVGGGTSSAKMSATIERLQ